MASVFTSFLDATSVEGDIIYPGLSSGGGGSVIGGGSGGNLNDYVSKSDTNVQTVAGPLNLSEHASFGRGITIQEDGDPITGMTLEGNNMNYKFTVLLGNQLAMKDSRYNLPIINFKDGDAIFNRIDTQRIFVVATTAPLGSNRSDIVFGNSNLRQFGIVCDEASDTFRFVEIQGVTETSILQMNNDLSCDFAGDVNILGTLNAGTIANLPPIGDVQFRYAGSSNGNVTNIAHSSNGNVITKDNSGMVAIGSEALTSTGAIPVLQGNDVAVGFRAMKEYIGTNSIAIGTDALASDSLNASTSAQNNVAIGHEAMKIIQGATGNIALGTNSYGNLRLGTNNIAIGLNAGTLALNLGVGSLVNDTSNICIGANSCCKAASNFAICSNSIALGEGVVTNDSNQFRLRSGMTFVSNGGNLGTRTDRFTTFNGGGAITNVLAQNGDLLAGTFISNPSDTNVVDNTFSPFYSFDTGVTEPASWVIPANTLIQGKSQIDIIVAGEMPADTLNGRWQKDDQVQFALTAGPTASDYIWMSEVVRLKEDVSSDVVLKFTVEVQSGATYVRGHLEYCKEEGPIRSLHGARFGSLTPVFTTLNGVNTAVDNKFMLQMRFVTPTLGAGLFDAKRFLITRSVRINRTY
jgi:hypothetical protein